MADTPKIYRHLVTVDLDKPAKPIIIRTPIVGLGDMDYQDKTSDYEDLGLELMFFSKKKSFAPDSIVCYGSSILRSISKDVISDDAASDTMTIVTKEPIRMVADLANLFANKVEVVRLVKQNNREQLMRIPFPFNFNIALEKDGALLYKTVIQFESSCGEKYLYYGDYKPNGDSSGASPTPDYYEGEIDVEEVE